MAQRLALNLAGIKSPLEVGEETSPATAGVSPLAPAKPRVRARRASATSSAAATEVVGTGAPEAAKPATASPARFYGGGRRYRRRSRST